MISDMRAPHILARSLLVLVALAPSLSFAAGPAGRLGALEPGTASTDLLAGRLSIRMPAGARVEPRRASIMSAPAADEDETRVMLDAGPERLVLLVSELFALAPDDFAAAARKDAGPDAQLAPLQLPSPLRAQAVTPAKVDATREAVFVLGVYVAQADRTVQHLAFYVNPAAARDVAGATALARKLAATITPGRRALTAAAGVRRLRAYGDKKDLAITLPAGWLATVQNGPDFLVHHLRQLAPLGGDGASIGVYLGGHPSYQHRQADIDPARVKTSKARAFGRDVEWHEWPAPDGNGSTAEAIVPLPLPGDDHLVAHVWVHAPAAQLADVRRIAGTLSVVDRTSK